MTTFAEIQMAAAAQFKVSRADLNSASRLRRYARPRQMAWLVAYDTGRFTLRQLGMMTGDRHHATVLKGIDTIETLCADQPGWRLHKRAIEARLDGVA